MFLKLTTEMQRNSFKLQLLFVSRRRLVDLTPSLVHTIVQLIWSSGRNLIIITRNRQTLLTIRTFWHAYIIGHWWAVIGQSKQEGTVCGSLESTRNFYNDPNFGAMPEKNLSQVNLLYNDCRDKRSWCSAINFPPFWFFTSCWQERS